MTSSPLSRRRALSGAATRRPGSLPLLAACGDDERRRPPTDGADVHRDRPAARPATADPARADDGARRRAAGRGRRRHRRRAGRQRRHPRRRQRRGDPADRGRVQGLLEHVCTHTGCTGHRHHRQDHLPLPRQHLRPRDRRRARRPGAGRRCPGRLQRRGRPGRPGVTATCGRTPPHRLPGPRRPRASPPCWPAAAAATATAAAGEPHPRPAPPRVATSEVPGRRRRRPADGSSWSPSRPRASSRRSRPSAPTRARRQRGRRHRRIVCPLHGSRFSIDDGSATRGPATPAARPPSRSRSTATTSWPPDRASRSVTSVTCPRCRGVDIDRHAARRRPTAPGSRPRRGALQRARHGLQRPGQRRGCRLPVGDAAGALRARLDARDGVQGRVPASDYDSGRAAKGYRCNARQVGHQGRTGGFKVHRHVDRQGHQCAYYDSTRTFPTDIFEQSRNGLGVIVLDVDDPRHPRRTAQLTTPAMLSPHESLVLNKKPRPARRRHGDAFAGPGILEIYDVGTDCRQPEAALEQPGGDPRPRVRAGPSTAGRCTPRARAPRPSSPSTPPTRRPRSGSSSSST